ncbi:MAG: hypothetical protein ABJH82_00345 [Polaribacter sp.]|uniref:hypothetical protein n=1 Tax=Polaribacter sp. TaxID=1920175 RepID=UPI003265DB04
MKLKQYLITQQNNRLEIFKPDKQQTLFSSFWFMEFGKTLAEIFDANEKLVYTVTKKFKFWRLRMVYLIARNVGNETILISQNTRNTVFKVELLSGSYEIKVHYKKKKSIYKDNIKIAEIDESFSDGKKIKLLALDDSKINVIFLLYSCLQIGENELSTKTIMKSQKKLEVNEDPWF